MGLRRAGRELALKALYQADVSGDSSRESIHQLFSNTPIDDRARRFASQLVDGVLLDREIIDKLLSEVVANWSIARLSRIDHNILRLSLYELMRLEDVPARVTLDEAIELAKRYGDSNSAQFVNGVLDQAATRLGVKDKGEEGAAGKHS